MDYADAFSMGEEFTALQVLAFGLKTDTDVSDLLAYLGYRADKNGRLEPAKELLGTLPKGVKHGL